MGFIKLFTKKPTGEEYPSALAYSVHMSYSTDGVEYSVLNQDYGMLFTKGVIREDNTIEEKGIRSPYMFRRVKGGYGFVATRINADGTDDETNGMYQYWISDNLVEYIDKEMCSIAEIADDLGEDAEELSELLTDHTEYSEFVFEINDSEVANMLKIWMPIHNTGIEVPDNIRVNCIEDIYSIKAVAKYSDGSSHVKSVRWDDREVKNILANKSDNNSLSLTINGEVEHKVYRFPLACGYADPVVFKYEDEWYFIATNDNTDDVGLFVRKARNIEDLFAEDVKEYKILDYDEDRQLIQTFWAPEFHMIGGELYILFAVGPKDWGPQSHMMKLKKGGSIIDVNSWEDPVKVRRKDGDVLCNKGITLDMTYVKAAGRSYVVWSERYHIGSKLDSGSMIYIAEIDENNPYQLISDPVLLTRPVYGWENQYGTINNEGPYPLYRDGKVYIAYSGGSAGGYSYVVAFLSINENANLLDATAWKKSLTPALSAHSVEGEYGPGHNSFYVDDNKDVWIAYHAKETIGFTARCSAIRRVHFDINGEPVLNMSEERDLAPENRLVSTTIIID